MRLTSVLFLHVPLLLLAGAASAATCPAAAPAARLLAATVWQTTAVYEGEDRSRNLLAAYPAVVGISRWDACSNRFEYFDPASGVSRAADGGRGYFFFTGDGRFQVTLPDGGSPLRRQIEALTGDTFTYSRQVPRGMQAGQPSIILHVVHRPYAGPLTIPAQSD